MTTITVSTNWNPTRRFHLPDGIITRLLRGYHLYTQLCKCTLNLSSILFNSNPLNLTAIKLQE